MPAARTLKRAGIQPSAMVTSVHPPVLSCPQCNVCLQQFVCTVCTRRKCILVLHSRNRGALDLENCRTALLRPSSPCLHLFNLCLQSKEAQLKEHAENRHPKSTFADCFPDFGKA